MTNRIPNFDLDEWKDSDLYRDTDFVANYVEDGMLPNQSNEFDREFVIGLNDYIGNTGTRSDAARYLAGVGAREANETTHEFEEVLDLNTSAAVEAIHDDRGIMLLFSTFSPFGHGFLNPHRKSEDISMSRMISVMEEGFKEYRSQESEEYRSEDLLDALFSNI